MGYVVGMPLEGAATEKDYQVRFGKNMMWQEEVRSPHLPAEWALQSGVQLTWPHEDTDWAPMLDEVERCFTDIAREVARRERLLVVHPRPEEIKQKLEREGLPFDLLLPLIDETAAKVHDLAPREAQTGPAVRYDREVINRQLDLLADRPELRQLYAAMSQSIHQYARQND